MPGSPSATPVRASDPAPAGTDGRLESLIRDYGRLISHAVRRAGGDTVANDREDIEQQVLVALWKQLAREQTIDHPASYVYRAAVRETVRAVARLRARPDVPLDALRHEPRAQRQADADGGVEAREQREALAAALGGIGAPSMCGDRPSSAQRGRAVGAPHVPARHPAMIPCTCVLPGL